MANCVVGGQARALRGGDTSCSTSQGRKYNAHSAGRVAPCSTRREITLKQHTLAASPRLISSKAILGQQLLNVCSNGHVWQAAQWLENSAEVEVDLPVDVVWAMWRDRTAIPQWMPWISSVELVPEDDTLSRWVLSTYQFGNTWTLSWLAKDLTPVKHQKIHWRSVPGSSSTSLLEVPNRGSVRFYKKSATVTGLKLTVSYEIPTPLLAFANALAPVVDGILRADMARFKEYALKQHQAAEANPMA